MKIKLIFTLLFIISPLSANYTPLVSSDKSNVATKNSTSRKQIPLTTAKKTSTNGKLFKNISDKQVQSKKTGALEKNFESLIHKEATINLYSSSYFTYSISYKKWVKNSDGSLSLKTVKQVVGKHSKSKTITASFFKLSDLTMHMGSAGQKDTKFTFTDSSIINTLVKNHFKNDENPSLNLKVAGTLIKPKTSFDYINSKSGKSTEIGTFKIESAASWWAANSIVLNFVITILFIAIATLGFTPICLKFLKGVTTDVAPSIKGDVTPSLGSETSSESGDTTEDNSPSITTETSSDGESIVLGSESEDLAPKVETPVKKKVSWGESDVKTYNGKEPIIAKEVTTKSASNDPQQIVHSDVHEDSTNAKTNSNKQLSNSGSNELSDITPTSLETINENSNLIVATEAAKVNEVGKTKAEAIADHSDEISHAANDDEVVKSKSSGDEIIEKVGNSDLRDVGGLSKDEIDGNWDLRSGNELEIDSNEHEESKAAGGTFYANLDRLFEDFYDANDHNGYMTDPVFGGENYPISYDQAELGDRITVRAPGFDPSIENGNQSASGSKLENENPSISNSKVNDDNSIREIAGNLDHSSFWEDILINNINLEYGDGDVDFTRQTIRPESYQRTRWLDLPTELSKWQLDRLFETQEAIISREKDPSEDDFAAKYPELVKPYEKNTDAFEQSMLKMEAEAKMISDDYTTMTRKFALRKIKGFYEEHYIGLDEDGKDTTVYRYMHRKSADLRFYQRTVRWMEWEHNADHTAAVKYYSDLLKEFFWRGPKKTC